MKLPAYHGFQGSVPAGLFQGDSPAPRLKPIFSTVQNVVYEDSVTAGRWKFVSEALGPGEWLFQLDSDPLESHNLLRSHSEIARCLRETLRGFRNNQLVYYGSAELKQRYFAPAHQFSPVWCDLNRLVR